MNDVINEPEGNRGIYNWNGETIGIIASTMDSAAVTIAQALEGKYNLPVIYLKDQSALSLTLTDLPIADHYIFLSKHSSSVQKPAFTVHSVGNYGSEAILGGKPHTLGYSHAIIQTKMLTCFDFTYQQSDSFSDFDVTIEATHHGPLIDKPIIFIEMGSNEIVWNNIYAGQLVAKTVFNFLTKPTPVSPDHPVAIGFGGTHYNSKFTKQMIDQKYYIGHICPKYAVTSITEDLVNQMIQKTIPKPTIALFDRKGMKRKIEIRAWLENQDLDVVQI